MKLFTILLNQIESISEALNSSHKFLLQPNTSDEKIMVVGTDYCDVNRDSTTFTHNCGFLV